jgi:hypothetical protein
LSHYPVHEPVNVYFHALENFEDPYGTKHKFGLLRILANKGHNGITGYFGKVHQTTHYLYKSVPAQRVVADLEFTTHQQHSHVWDLPEALRPEESEREEIDEVEVEEFGPHEALHISNRKLTRLVAISMADKRTETNTGELRSARGRLRRSFEKIWTE